MLLASWATAPLLGGPAWAADFNIANEAQLRSAITSASSGDRIVFQSNITLTADLPLVQTNVAIVGNNNTLSGNNQFRGLLVGAFSGSTQVPVSVSIQDLTITNTKAAGGSGGTGWIGGGGGAGLGGALFVANQATVTVSNVSLIANAAIGGNGGGSGEGGGGGGGMGGNGGNGAAVNVYGGGGGLGVGANGGSNTSNGQPGIATGASPGGTGWTYGGPAGSGGASGGGGGGGVDNVGGGGGGGIGGQRGGADDVVAGQGGFGGGSGAGDSPGTGGFGGGGGAHSFGHGDGGFGGGGGGGGGGVGAGHGGFGGGNGQSGALGGGGGGGLGAGGGIFVQQGGNLTLAGPLTVNGNTVTAGSGAGDNNDGSAFGSGLFLQGNGTLTFAPGAGQIQTVADAIADQTGSGGTGGNAGSYRLVKTGGGTTILSGASTYSGGTTVSDGTLQGNTQSLQGDITNNAAAVFDQNFLDTYAGIMSGSGSLTKIGTGTLVLTATNTYTGGTFLNAGTVSISQDANLGGAAGGLTFNGGGLQTTTSFSTARTITLGAGGGTFRPAVTTTLTVNSAIGGSGGLTMDGLGTLMLTGANSYSGGTTILAGTLALSGGGSLASSSGVDLAGAGATFDISSSIGNQTIRDLSGVAGTTVNLGGTTLSAGTANTTTFAGQIIGSGAFVKQGAGTLILDGANSYTGGTTVAQGVLAGTTSSLQGNILNNASVVFAQNGSGTHAGNMSGTGSLALLGGTVTLSGINTYSGGTTVSGGTLVGNTTSLQGNILNNASVVFDQATDGSYAGNMSGTGMLTKSGAGTLIVGGSNSYSGGTMVSGGLLQGTTTSIQGAILNNASVAFNQSTTGTYTGDMFGTGSLLINGTGTVILSGINSYSGGTTVSGGVLQGNSASLQGNILNNASVVFNQTGSGTYAGVMSGMGSMTLQGGGTLLLTGINSYTGGTMVDASTLVVNGSLAGSVTLNNGGVLGGNGSIGTLLANNATLSPGNSIGTLNINGNFTQTGGTYIVEANAQGQSDRINVAGIATINGATVQVVAASGNYATSTTYTILNATGGVAGAYAGVTSNFAFLTPSLSYGANNVFLTLALQGAAFSGFGGNTVNQRGVGYALDQSYANATGDFATVIGALANLSTAQAGPALNTISGQPYADFGSFNVANNALFMNALGQQMALARGASGSGQRQALAEACDVAACDGASPFSVWGSVLGGVGLVQGDGNSSTFTYNVGGTAAGIDYRVNPSLLVGFGAGYSSGTQWVDGFQGKGWSNSVSVAAYASFTQWGAYLDALAGYAYSNNQLQRQISIPGLQPRTANGSTGANQFLAQAEAGYKFGIYAPAAATVTPFARFQTSSINQAAFSEWGANSLSLNVAQQITTSVRTILGADLAGSIGLGDTRTLDLGLRLGWLHEYADTARPMTAAFAGAPSASFTVYGATPQRDAAVIGFQAAAPVAAGTQLYLRYDGEIGSNTGNHAVNLGMRLSW